MNISKRTGIIAGITVVGLFASITSIIKDRINSKNNTDIYDHIYDDYAQNEELIPEAIKDAQIDAIYHIGPIDSTAIIVDKVKDKLDKSVSAKKFMKKCFEEDVDYYTSNNLMVSLIYIYGYTFIIVTEWENDSRIVEIVLPRSGNNADILDIDQIAIMMMS